MRISGQRAAHILLEMSFMLRRAAVSCHISTDQLIRSCRPSVMSNMDPAAACLASGAANVTLTGTKSMEKNAA